MELYKKYRPRTWETTIGNQNIINSLREIAKSQNPPTGLLLSGPPGIGKTTSAFILAKALNCEHPDENGNPCNECETCKAIDDNSQIGVKYISLANNGTADDIRRIMSEARIAQPVKKQIWILDEIQNLSPAAFDAMLIALEDTKMKSMFICCTTEPDKVRPAVLSRLQARNFLPITWRELGRYLRDISQKENLNVDDYIIKQIALLSNGSIRNGLQLLETYSQTRTLPTSYDTDIIKAIESQDVVNVISTIKKMEEDGVDFTKSLENIYNIISEVILNTTLKKEEIYSTLSSLLSQNGKIESILKIMGEGLLKISVKNVSSKIIYEITIIRILTTLKK